MFVSNSYESTDTLRSAEVVFELILEDFFIIFRVVLSFREGWRACFLLECCVSWTCLDC